jgi:type I restriction enzyme, S subunit
MSSEVPGGWRETKLGDHCRIDIGGTPSRDKPQFWSNERDGHPWVSIADLKKPLVNRTKEFISDLGIANSNVKPVPRGTVMMSFKLTIGRTAIAGRDLFTNEAIAAFNPSDDLDNGFLFYALPHAAAGAETDQAIKGATLNKAKLRDLSILLPSLDEQRQIAEVLRSADEAVSLAQQAAEQHLTLWEALVDDLIWRPTVEDVGLLVPLHRSIETSDYGVNAPLHDQPNGVAVLRMGNIQQGQIDLTNLKWGEIGQAEASALKLRDGDILFNRTNSRDLVGKVALVRGEPDYLYASYLVRLSIKRSIADPYFVFAAMNSRRGQADIRTIATPGVSQSNINPTNLKKLLFPQFSLERQREISILLQEVEAAWLGARRQVDMLHDLRASVGSQLLSGRVRVPA